MNHWEPTMKPAELAEHRLVAAILDGSFPINSNLPPERDLAEQLGVTRPTLREALQRLSREGWVEIHHGRSTRVRNYWQEGNLSLLSTISRHKEAMNPDFVTNLLEIRLLLAPKYTRLAIEHAQNDVIHLLEQYQNMEDSAEIFSSKDLDLHIRLTILSGNPIFTLILNGFRELYIESGQAYFSNPQARDHSRSFYKKLYAAVLSNDVFSAESVTHRVMQDSLDLWKAASKLSGNQTSEQEK